MNADIKTRPIKRSDRTPWCTSSILTNHGKHTRMAGGIASLVAFMKGETLKMITE